MNSPRNWLSPDSVFPLPLIVIVESGLLMAPSSLRSVMVPRPALKLMLNVPVPAVCWSRIAWRSDPAPLSALVVTVKVVWARAVAGRYSTATTPSSTTRDADM